MVAHVLHVINEALSVQKCIEAGMQSPSVGFVCGHPTFVPVGGTCKRHHCKHHLSSIRLPHCTSTLSKSTSWLSIMS